MWLSVGLLSLVSCLLIASIYIIHTDVKLLKKSLGGYKEMLAEYEMLAEQKQYSEIVKKGNTNKVGKLPSGKKLI